MLPDKTIKLSFSLLGVGAELLKNIAPNDTVTSLWERVKRNETISTYEKFIKGLLVLHTLGAIKIEQKIIKRVVR